MTKSQNTFYYAVFCRLLHLIFVRSKYFPLDLVKFPQSVITPDCKNLDVVRYRKYSCNAVEQF
jgi:hypothetical protein